jgi:hypothetical protein
MRSATRRVWATIVLLLACLTLTLGNAPGAAAQTGTAIELVAISPQVRGTTDSLRIELRAPGAAATDTVRLMIYNRASRTLVRSIVDGRTRPSQLVSSYNPVNRRVAEVSDAARNALVMSVPNDQLPLTAGVYPLQITVGSSAPVLSFLIRTSPLSAGEVPYTVSLVAPVRAPLAEQPNGSVLLDARERSRLARLTTVLDRAPSGITLVPNPETLDALDALDPDARATLQQLQSVAQRQSVLQAPFVPIDVDAWRRADRDEHVSLQLRTGLDVMVRTLGRDSTAISARTVVANRYETPASLELFRREGAANVVLADTQLEPPRSDAFPSPFAQSFRVRDAGGQDLLAAAADTWLGAAIAAIDTAPQPGTAAQRVLADLAAAFFDRPSLARGSVVVLPDDWAPSSAVVDQLLTPLRATDLLTLRDIDTFFSTVARSSPEGEGRPETVTSGPLRRTMVITRGQDMDEHAAAVDSAKRTLESYLGLFPASADNPLDAVDKLLMVASDLRLDTVDRARYVDAATTFVSRSLRTPDGRLGITIPESERITLTSRNETIRLVVENRLTTPAVVRIDLRSEKLSFPNGSSVTVTLQPGPNSVDVEVSVKTSGDSLLEYTVNAPSGSLGELAKGKLRVRSIALSGLGLVISVVAVVVLVAWWARHGMKSRRRRRAVAIID